MIKLVNQSRNIRHRAQKVGADQRGISLLEAMAALLVLMIGIVSVMVLMLSNTQAARISRDQLIASNLAREGVEIARSVRDSNWLKIVGNEKHPGGTPYKWDDGLWDSTNTWYGAYPTYNGTAWNLVYTDAGVEADVWKVYQDPTGFAVGGLYNQYTAAPPLGATVTKYTREVFTYPICYDNATQLENLPLNADGQVCDPGTTKIGIQVKAEVKWSDNGHIRTASIESRLYNWK